MLFIPSTESVTSVSQIQYLSIHFVYLCLVFECHTFSSTRQWLFYLKQQECKIDYENNDHNDE